MFSGKLYPGTTRGDGSGISSEVCSFFFHPVEFVVSIYRNSYKRTESRKGKTNLPLDWCRVSPDRRTVRSQ